MAVTVSVEMYPFLIGELGTAFDTTFNIAVQQINDAQVRFFRQQLVVDFVVGWMQNQRNVNE